MTSEHHPSPRSRILLVEDDPDTARFITHVLTSRGGFHVEHAPSPAAALPRAAAERWDLVITDIEMPDMTGIELLESLRRKSPALPVAVITAHVTVDNTLGALRGQADDFMQKPLRPDSLIAAVTRLLDHGRGGRGGRGGREAVLAVGAHPDDVEIGAAGTLLMHRAAGHDVAILTLSRGARGGEGVARSDEARQAAQILGAELYLENLEDTQIAEPVPTISAIKAVVDAVQPTVVYTHSIHDVHQDHRNTHRAAMAAARGVGSVFCFQSPSATVDFRPARFISIDDHLPGKLAAIGAFASQTAVRQYLEPDLIEATARYWSRYGSGRHAEAFEVIRDQAASPEQSWMAQEAAALDRTVRENAPDEDAAAHLLEAGHVTT